MKNTIKKTASTLALAGILSLSAPGGSTFAQTPEILGCHDESTSIQHPTPATETSHGDMEHDTSTADTHELDFDLMYIDMMIPHHESVIALAEVAAHELSDPRLIEMADSIIETQDQEISFMKELRNEWYGGMDPVPMDVMHSMPGMSGEMEAMDQQMSSEWQVQTFCQAENKDLAFIDQIIPHHQMAIDTSEAALVHSEHQEMKDVAKDVIEAQQAEIDELEAIRMEILGEATPES